MTSAEKIVKQKSPLQGVARVVQFNWPLYALALVVLLAGTIVFQAVDPTSQWRYFLLAGIILLGLQVANSLAASYWVYDLSPLCNWRWLREICGNEREIHNIINIHSGYDETTGALSTCFPGAAVTTIDLYPALDRIEPSIEKARRLYPPQSVALCTTIDGWPMADGSIDLVLIALSAHELRTREDRVRLLKQVRRVLNPEVGSCVLVEHLRDVANALAYGPGCLHFHSAPEWLACIDLAELRVRNQFRITPFVGVFVLSP